MKGSVRRDWQTWVMRNQIVRVIFLALLVAACGPSMQNSASSTTSTIAPSDELARRITGMAEQYVSGVFTERPNLVSGQPQNQIESCVSQMAVNFARSVYEPIVNTPTSVNSPDLISQALNQATTATQSSLEQFLQICVSD